MPFRAGAWPECHCRPQSAYGQRFTFSRVSHVAEREAVPSGDSDVLDASRHAVRYGPGGSPPRGRQGAQQQVVQRTPITTGPRRQDHPGGQKTLAGQRTDQVPRSLSDGVVDGDCLVEFLLLLDQILERRPVIYRFDHRLGPVPEVNERGGPGRTVWPIPGWPGRHIDTFATDSRLTPTIPTFRFSRTATCMNDPKQYSVCQ